MNYFKGENEKSLEYAIKAALSPGQAESKVKSRGRANSESMPSPPKNGSRK